MNVREMELDRLRERVNDLNGTERIQDERTYKAEWRSIAKALMLWINEGDPEEI